MWMAEINFRGDIVDFFLFLLMIGGIAGLDRVAWGGRFLETWRLIDKPVKIATCIIDHLLR